MISTEKFYDKLVSLGFDFASGVPCSYMNGVFNIFSSKSDISYVPATNEGDAVALCSGYAMGNIEDGKHRTMVLMQNSGLGNAVSPLTSLSLVFKTPMLVMISMRGYGFEDEPQHKFMGPMTKDMVKLLSLSSPNLVHEITHETTDEEAADILSKSVEAMDFYQEPVYLLVHKDVFPKAKMLPDRMVETLYMLDNRSIENVLLKERNSLTKHTSFIDVDKPMYTRKQALEKILSEISPEAIIIATTGMTGRELHDLNDRAGNIYMVGSMGCASMLGLGISLSSDLPVVVIDGDGSFVMRMGACCTIGIASPNNFLHIVLDNDTYDTTGGQSTMARFADFSEIACGAGYAKSFDTCDIENLGEIMHETETTFARVFILPGSSEPGRPKVTPTEVSKRIKKHIESCRNLS